MFILGLPNYRNSKSTQIYEIHCLKIEIHQVLLQGTKSTEKSRQNVESHDIYEILSTSTESLERKIS